MEGAKEIHDLVGKTACYVSEKTPNLYQRVVEILSVRGDIAKVSPEHLPHSVDVRIEDLDLLPRLAPNPPPKKGVLSRPELEECKLRFEDGFQLLQTGDCLNERHLMMGNWMISRDSPGIKGVYLVPPPARVHPPCCGRS